MALLLLGIACANGDDAVVQSGEITIAYLRSMCDDSSLSITRDYTIRGRVVANDRLGELPCAIVIDDGTAGVQLEIESSDVNSFVPLYSEVSVRLIGLNVGHVGAKCLLGAAPTGEFVVDRIAEDRIYNLLSVSLAPEAPPEPLHRRIAELSPREVGRYVAIDSLRFVEEERGLCWCSRDTLTGRAEISVRHLTDGRDTLPVVVAASCRYGDEQLPTELLRCYGVVDYHGGELALRIINRGIVTIRVEDD